MIRIVRGMQDRDHQRLLDQMFKARARLFRDRMGWDVTVDQNGREIDEYDALNPIYVILTDDDDNHLGSIRVMPTTERHMLADHFAQLIGGLEVRSPHIQEVTRLCVGSTQGTAVTARGLRMSTSMLLIGLYELGVAEGWTNIIAIFDRAATQIYKRVGLPITLLGEAAHESGSIYFGIWEVSRRNLDIMRTVAGIDGPLLPGSSGVRRPERAEAL